MTRKIPIIDITDLYHPSQDTGDNFDILTPFALPEIELKAVVLDATEKFRHPGLEHSFSCGGEMRTVPTNGPREPGFIPMMQMNYIFNQNVPFAVGPMNPMRSPQDCMIDIPQFQQLGINLILDTLRNSEEPVEVLLFGSVRSFSAAYNREPELVKEKVKRVHMSAGASSPDSFEWNVTLDPNAIVCLLRSGLPIALYPCSTHIDAFDYGPHNTFWKLPNLRFIRDMHPQLKSYLGYAFTMSNRIDFLRAMNEDWSDNVMNGIYEMEHHVWETAVWLEVTGRKLVKRSNGAYRILMQSEVLPSDYILPNELKACNIQVQENGLFSFEYTNNESSFWMYDRIDAVENERALREALPELYKTYSP